MSKEEHGGFVNYGCREGRCIIKLYITSGQEVGKWR